MTRHQRRGPLRKDATRADRSAGGVGGVLESVAVVAAGDQVTVWDDQETAANHYLACIGANLDAEIRVMTRARWERVRAELVGQQPSLTITDMRKCGRR